MSDNTCAICLDECTNRGILNCCDHKYCKGCIKQWVKKKNTCPQCQRRIKSIKYGRRRVTVPRRDIRPESLSMRDIFRDNVIRIIESVVENHERHLTFHVFPRSETRPGDIGSMFQFHHRFGRHRMTISGSRGNPITVD